MLASHNAGKLRELRRMLEPWTIEVTSVGELGLPEPAETGTTFHENARIKARAAVRASGEPALADDSGIEVAGLDGAPGVYSADWAPGRDFSVAIERVLRELRHKYGSGDAAETRARFVCVLCLAWPDGHEEFVEGTVDGHITERPRGTSGFGYDPIFQPDGEPETFGEMAPERKEAMSHRARAMQSLLRDHFPPRPR